VAPSPLRLTLPGEPPGQQRERICFSYETIEMWEMHPEDILDLGHAVLYPLLPLTKGGATQQIVTHMFDLLSGRQNRNYAIIGYAFATCTFELLNQSEDLKWLKERFRHMDDDILVGSPVYQWILEKGEAKGEAKGVAQGVAQSITQTRQTVVDCVHEHFPELAQLAEEVVATIDNLPQLLDLLVKLGGAQSAEQACKILSQLAQ
jgi:predicted transposase YdaD